jgi:hypothetical protein
VAWSNTCQNSIRLSAKCGEIVVQLSRLPNMWGMKQQAGRLHHKLGGAQHSFRLSRGLAVD